MEGGEQQEQGEAPMESRDKLCLLLPLTSGDVRSPSLSITSGSSAASWHRYHYGGPDIEEQASETWIQRLNLNPSVRDGSSHSLSYFSATSTLGSDPSVNAPTTSVSSIPSAGLHCGQSPDDVEQGSPMMIDGINENASMRDGTSLSLSYFSANSSLRSEPSVNGTSTSVSFTSLNRAGSPGAVEEGSRTLIDNQIPSLSFRLSSTGDLGWRRAGVASAGLDNFFSWRKYGEKHIVGSNYPRVYYRWANRHTKNCKAVKCLQMSNHDPLLYHVEYRGAHSHTCISQSLLESSVYCWTKRLKLVNKTGYGPLSKRFENNMLYWRDRKTVFSV